MSGDHTITLVGNKWRVDFKRRRFTREFGSEETAKTVVAADLVLTEAEDVALYAAVEIGIEKRRELATELRQAAAKLQNLGGFDFTVREFQHMADNLAAK